MDRDKLIKPDDSPDGQTPESPDEGPKKSLFRSRNFLLLWLGEAISLIGDQFHLVALPWLVLQLTGDALAMGTVLAVAAVPRAVFIVVGGAVTDRFSPRSVMLASNLARMAVVGGLTVLVFGGSVELWALYLFALAFGLADAFFFPASSAIVPRLAPKEQLHTANAIVFATAQLSLLAGPVLAGLLIAVFGNDAVAQSAEVEPELRGIALAFAVDTLTFLASALTLWMIRMPKTRAGDEGAEEEGMLRSIYNGLQTVWRHPVMRPLLLLISGINLFFMGPFMVGIPYLSDIRFPEGAAAFGILLSAFGGGALVGTVCAGALPGPTPKWLGLSLGALVLVSGVGIILLGFAPTTLIAGIICVAMGLSNGYTSIIFVTWLQQRTADAMLGRIMSLVMLASLGLQPISMALSGALIKIDVIGFFTGAGALLIAVVVYANLNPNVRRMGLEVTEIGGDSGP